ncbi:related to tRNA-specific adenosine deaminase 1 [Ramularia collo-cygni]|uniref:Related to tRNA-specific adenosine deaminase 1 n=1 Tax=Ramularia collo-cygni TaxID=112498 RepID=A0A2D3USM6_9PEZI|nr:related to tRNA-specific adenosine deaminase 1 [Ramularia collo-cygni]CZT15690.1 related to tRNA-specific adenosine deaminase 1 [Ramularia collo-cygni]
MIPTSRPDDVARCVLDTFDILPAAYRPRQLPEGRREWVPLAGIVLSRGMKCLPQSKISSANGNVLHDWHAEILAIRAFNRFLVDECADLARRGLGSETAWIRWRQNVEKDEVEDAAGWQGQPFALRDDVKIHMYCSEAPCGDASMELTMAEQEDATPWTSTLPTEEKDGMLGRGHFDQLGVVRRKPARPDAPATLSKSCSDKMALKQCTGLLSSVVSSLIHPGSSYLESVVLPESQCISQAVNRAFGKGGRMKELANEELQDRWRSTGFAFRPFHVTTTKREFNFSRRGPQAAAVPNVSSNLSAVYTPTRREILVNGVLQGRKQLDPKGASCVSRRKMWMSVLDVALLVGLPALTSALGKRTYSEMKASGIFKGRKRVKMDARELSLKGWKRNEGDEQWCL